MSAPTEPYLVLLSDGDDMGYVTVWAFDVDDACVRAIDEANADISLLHIPVERSVEEIHVVSVTRNPWGELCASERVPDAYVDDFTLLEREADAFQSQLDHANERMARLEAELSAWRAGEMEV
jgi:hypothetical protein